MPKSSSKDINLELEEGIGGVFAKLKRSKPKEVKLLHPLAPSPRLVMDYKFLWIKFLLHIFVSSFKFPIAMKGSPHGNDYVYLFLHLQKYGLGFFCKG
jgi:hypothetical protein